jgi:hypothetical protein
VKKEIKIEICKTIEVLDLQYVLLVLSKTITLIQHSIFFLKAVKAVILGSYR